jgi:hypothetical protein
LLHRQMRASHRMRIRIAHNVSAVWQPNRRANATTFDLYTTVGMFVWRRRRNTTVYSTTSGKNMGWGQAPPKRAELRSSWRVRMNLGTARGRSRRAATGCGRHRCCFYYCHDGRRRGGKSDAASLRRSFPIDSWASRRGPAPMADRYGGGGCGDDGGGGLLALRGWGCGEGGWTLGWNRDPTTARFGRIGTRLRLGATCVSLQDPSGWPCVGVVVCRWCATLIVR